MSEIAGFIVVHPEHEIDFADIAMTEEAAWLDLSYPRDPETCELDGWRVVPCKLVVEDGK